MTMADHNQAAAAAAASLPPVSKDDKQEKVPVVSAPPVDDDKQVVNPHACPLLAVLVDVKEPPPASPLSISPPVAVVMPLDNNNKMILPMVVCLWALVNAVVFAAADIATLILNRTPCTKSTWLFRCVTLTEAAAAEVSLLLYGELLCSAAAALAAPLHMVLTTTTTATRGRWGAAAVHALAWVALAATVGMHSMEVASDRIILADNPGDKYIFSDVVFGSVELAVELLAGVLLLCCSPRRRRRPRQLGDGSEQV